MNHVVIFAGGIGSRMGNFDTVPKQFLKLNGKEIIVHTIERFQNNKNIDKIYIACNKDWIDFMKDLADKYQLSKVVSIVEGGKTGQLSIYNGLIEAEKNKSGDDDIVLIHDGVRPFIDDDLIDKNIESVMKYGSAISCAPATETIMLVDKDCFLEDIQDRSLSYFAKAPQSFKLDDILRYHRSALAENIDSFIDSCSLVRYYHHPLHLVQCSSDNIKVTTPKDFYVLQALFTFKENYATNNN